MIVSVSSLKGGVGKSTIAQNLAVMFAHVGWKATIIDADANQSSLKWSSLRSEALPSIPVFGLPDNASLAPNVTALTKINDVVIIDGTPSLSKLTSKILMVSDFLLIPLLPAAFDEWATMKFVDHYESACDQRGIKIPAAFVLNRTKRINATTQVKETLEATNIEMMQSALYDRVVYNKAAYAGTGVYEQKDAKAKAEVTRFFNELNEKL